MAPNGAQNSMKSFFIGVHFLWCFFRGSLGEFGHKSFAPREFACSCNYAINCRIYVSCRLSSFSIETYVTLG